MSEIKINSPHATSSEKSIDDTGPIRKVIPIRSSINPSEAEVNRQMQICNACRYCEGFCAVFPAMTRRLEFGKADIHYLANLCHNCGACLHACQYAAPHEFAVNVPKSMATVRAQTYMDYAWPSAFAVLYKRNGLALSLSFAGSFMLFLLIAVSLQGRIWNAATSGNFYNIFPHNLLVSLFAPIFLFSALALTIGVRRFWIDVKPVTSNAALSTLATIDGLGEIATLKYLDGGHGNGCNNEDDRFTLARRNFHHLTLYGFLLCFCATTLATIYHYAFGWEAPYDFPSLPKVLGVFGGLSLMIGTAGLWRLNLKRHPAQGDLAQKPMDLGFIALLFVTSVSGLLLWMGRTTPALGVLLCLHLGAVMALFAMLPYSKFAHGIFRSASLLRSAVERRRPNPVGLGND
jgi:citrate/tricarballylate utilization protein